MTASEFIFVRSSNKWCFNRESHAAFIPSAHPSDPLVPRSKEENGRQVFFFFQSRFLPHLLQPPSIGWRWWVAGEEERIFHALLDSPPKKYPRRVSLVHVFRTHPSPAMGYYTIEYYVYTLFWWMGCRWMDYTHRRHSRPQPDGHSHSYRVHTYIYNPHIPSYYQNG
jgi:hypothetical protein